jgi:hypothetical protein
VVVGGVVVGGVVVGGVVVGGVVVGGVVVGGVVAPSAAEDAVYPVGWMAGFDACSPGAGRGDERGTPASASVGRTGGWQHGGRGHRSRSKVGRRI